MAARAWRGVRFEPSSPTMAATSSSKSSSLARRLCAAGLTLARQAGDLAHLGTLLAAMATLERLAGNLPEARATLARGQLREARERGTMMTPAVTAVLIIVTTISAQEATAQQEATGSAAGKLLSPRERELVTLVAQGHTNAEIAARLYISVRTVASHLDRIRDKTGNRRRADLTRLAIEENPLVRGGPAAGGGGH
jgi:DNA-binding CsgD family transcriptional regulator